jgi:hypothetical protein
VKRDAWLHRPGCAWAAAGAAAGLLVLAAVLAVTAVSRRANMQMQAVAPVVTLLPRPSPTEMVPPSATVLPTETPQPSTAPDSSTGRIDVGLIVEVYGTEGDGLRLRASPGTAGSIQLLADESEVFAVQDGPVEADGRSWFYLVSPSDASRAGWAVSDYLRLAQ